MTRTTTPERNLGKKLVMVVLAMTLAALMAPHSAAAQTFPYKPPAVFASTDDGTGFIMYFDGVVLGDVLDAPRSVYTTGAGGRAWAAASVNQFDAGALGGAVEFAYASGWSFVEFLVPGDTTQFVKVNISSKLGPTATKGFKGAATVAAPLNPYTVNSVGFSVMVYPMPAVWPQVTLNGDRVVAYELPHWQPGGVNYAYRLHAQAQAWWAPESEGGPPVVQSAWRYDSFYDGDTIVGQYGEGEGRTVTVDVFPSINIRRGVRYVVAIWAGAGCNSISVVDPILEPHPDNPDIVIEYPNAAVEPNPRSIMADVTHEELEALGIDPQPFIDLGFLEPSSPTDDVTAPTTSASTMPQVKPKGWTRTPVTVTLNAVDNEGGSGVKEVHYSLAGAATGSWVVPGDTATLTIAVEGTTTLSYFAVDNAGNPESAKTITVRIRQPNRQ